VRCSWCGTTQQIIRHGHLLNSLPNALYYRWWILQQITGTFSVYDDRVTFKVSALNAMAGAGASHEIPMAEIVSVRRHRVFGIIPGLSIRTKNGKKYAYTMRHIAEIVELISRHKTGGGDEQTP
jgi:hypothetical protein